MPELPEVETVREGLDRWVTGRTIAGMQIGHPRSVRRHAAGAEDLVARSVGRTVRAVSRRGKYLWLPLVGSHATATGSSPEHTCLVAHLGMSGQLLVQPAATPPPKHQHVRLWFTDDGPELRFVDQRTFGAIALDDLAPAPDRPAEHLPVSIVHIARDPLDPHFDEHAWSTRLRRRDTELKRALLDQSLISGIGNIYADESLWRARLHGMRRTGGLSRATTMDLLHHVREVLRSALRAGGTSFDALYVNVNGQSGYFDRSLAVYGRQDLPCPRCGRAIVRSAFMNRSSFWCPNCQRRPRRHAESAQPTHVDLVLPQ